MREVLIGLVFVTVLLGSGGFAVEGHHSAGALGADATGHAPPSVRYALVAALEVHDDGGAIGLERHPLCADGCSIAGAIAAVSAEPYVIDLLATRGPAIPSAGHRDTVSLPLPFFRPPR